MSRIVEKNSPIYLTENLSTKRQKWMHHNQLRKKERMNEDQCNIMVRNKKQLGNKELRNGSRESNNDEDDDDDDDVENIDANEHVLHVGDVNELGQTFASGSNLVETNTPDESAISKSNEQLIKGITDDVKGRQFNDEGLLRSTQMKTSTRNNDFQYS